MNEDLKEAARKRIKAKREFWTMVLVFVVITAILNTIWFLADSRDYYWPMWPMMGFLIAIFFTGISTYGPGSRPISDERIEREMRNMQGK